LIGPVNRWQRISDYGLYYFSVLLEREKNSAKFQNGPTTNKI
jgi:hypothetical protein